MNTQHHPPTPADFRPILCRMRRRALEAWIERAIALLDALDGDPDIEADGFDEIVSQPELRGGARAAA